MFAGEQINVTEDRAVLHVALRAPTRRVDRGRRRGRRAGGPRGARPDGRVRRARPLGRVDAGTPAGAIRNVVNIGIGGSDLGPVMAYEALRHYSDARPDLPLRLQRRRHRLRRGDARPRPRGDAVHRRVEDVHDARDDDERAHRARRGRWRARRRGGGREALRRRLDERRGGGGVRDRHRQHVRLLGLGRRPLLDGLGDRAVDDDRDRARRVPRDARRLPRDGRALPHGAVRAEPAGAARPADRLVRRLLRRADGRPSCRTTSTSKRFPAYLQQLTMESNGKSVDARRRAASTTRPARSTGASRARTGSTPSTSSSTRARS